MTENIEIKGIWWLPNNQDTTVSGILKYEPMGNTKLTIIGEFRCNDWLRSINATKSEDVIWGLSSDNKRISLLQNYPYATKKSTCPFPVMHYECQFLIIGKHITSLKEKSQYSVRILFDELSYWYRPNLIQSKCNNKTVGFIASTGKNSITEVQVTDYMKFILEPQIRYSQSQLGLKAEVEQTTDLVIRFSKTVHLQFILNVIKEFEQFLSIATLSPVQCKRIFVFDENNSTESGEKQKIEILHHFFREDYKPNTKFVHYLFTYNSIKDNFSNVLQRWYSNEDIMPIRTHLVDSLNRHGVFSSTDFLIVVQAIEGFYCRFRKDNVSLRNILKALVLEFKDIRCIEMEEDDYSKIVDSRHYFSHLLPHGKRAHVVHGMELYHLFFKLRKVLLCCVLNFMGLNNASINNIVTSSNNSYLIMINN